MPGIDRFTVLMLHCNGADASPTFIDSSKNNYAITTAGNAQIDTAQSKFGGGSGLFDGTGDYITIADSEDWNFGSADFTFDWWVRFNSNTGTGMAFFQQRVDDNNRILSLIDHDNNLLYFYIFNAAVTVASMSRTWNPSAATWYHVAILRNSNAVKMFVDGLQLGADETVTGTSPNLAAVVSIGARSSTSDLYLDGWLDEFRISKGIARWTANFAVPIVEYSITKNQAHIIT